MDNWLLSHVGETISQMLLAKYFDAHPFLNLTNHAVWSHISFCQLCIHFCACVLHFIICMSRYLKCHINLFFLKQKITCDTWKPVTMRIFQNFINEELWKIH